MGNVVTVVDVQKLEPMSLDHEFLKTDRTFPVFVEDIRVIDIQLIDKTRGSRGRVELSSVQL